MSDLYEICVKELGSKRRHLIRHLSPDVDIEAEVISVLEEMQEEREDQMACEVDYDKDMYYNKYHERWRYILNGNFLVTVKKGSNLLHMFTFKLG